MRPAVFLDRDGTIIELVDYLTDPAELVLIPGAARAIARLREAGYAVVVVTNQSAIGRGRLTEEGLAEIHRHLERELEAGGARLDGIYHCPLKPTVKDPRAIEHPDRKPGPGMLLRAARDLDLDLARSWMVGDNVADVLAGRNAGCAGSLLVETGYGARVAREEDLGAEVFAALPEAVDWILARAQN